ncbi:hypothetical protein KCTC52924_01113 [Arenibacter antarcticus]|nr:hypothetical protein [Arenibacter sp. H213]
MTLQERFLELENLKTESDSAVARKRGLDFEKLVRDLFFHHGLLSIINKNGYHTSDNKSEQIDGVVNFDGKIFLLEAKWAKKLAASSLYEFIGKIENKFHGTLGIYISYNKLNENFLNALRKGRKQNVIVIHGEDVKLLFNEAVNLKEFLKYTIEKLSFDNIPYISVKEFQDISKILQEKEININDDKINGFLKKCIVTKETVEPSDIQIELEKLNKAEQAKVFKTLFKVAPKLLKLAWPVPKSYFNTARYFRTYEPDFSISILKDLPDKYFSQYIFLNPKIYLLKFLEIFINRFDKIDQSAREIFFNKIVDLYKVVDFEGENNLTEIFEQFEELYPNEIKNELHKYYIDFYYSSNRDVRFPQKNFAKELFARKKIERKIIIEWITKKIESDLILYESKKDFNIDYFANTYRDLGKILNLDLSEWTQLLEEILKEI